MSVAVLVPENKAHCNPKASRGARTWEGCGVWVEANSMSWVRLPFMGPYILVWPARQECLAPQTRETFGPFIHFHGLSGKPIFRAREGSP
jgi:hypothetical protein